MIIAKLGVEARVYCAPYYQCRVFVQRWGEHVEESKRVNHTGRKLEAETSETYAKILGEGVCGVLEAGKNERGPKKVWSEGFGGNREDPKARSSKGDESRSGEGSIDNRTAVGREATENQ